MGLAGENGQMVCLEEKMTRPRFCAQFFETERGVKRSGAGKPTNAKLLKKQNVFLLIFARRLFNKCYLVFG